MVSQIEAILRDDYPSLYISFETRLDSDYLIAARLRYSLKYNQQGYPQLYDKQIVLRMNLGSYHNHPDLEYWMNDQLYRAVVDHLERDLSNLNGFEYLERYRDGIPPSYVVSDSCIPTPDFGTQHIPCPWRIEPRIQHGFRNLEPSPVGAEYYQNIFRQVLSDLNRSHEPLSGHWDGLDRPENKKAEKLLLRLLNEKQKKQYEKDKTFICYSNSGNVYHVLPKLQININVLDQDLNRKHSLCITPTETTPVADQQLTIKLLIENNEDYLLKTAIKWP